MEEQEKLQKDLVAYQQAIEENAGFQELKAAVIALQAQCEKDPTDVTLQDELFLQQAFWEEHPLYEQGLQLGVAAQELRMQATQEAKHLLINHEDQLLLPMSEATPSQIKACEKEAEVIKSVLVKPLRSILGQANSPARAPNAASFGQGAIKRVVDTGKGLLKIGKFCIQLQLGMPAFTSKDAAEIVEKSKAAVDFLQALFDQTQQDWENPRSV